MPNSKKPRKSKKQNNHKYNSLCKDKPTSQKPGR